VSYTSGGALVADHFSPSFAVPEDAHGRWGRLKIDLAPSSLALAHEIVRALVAAPERSLIDEASLLLTTAALSDTRVLAQSSLDRLGAAQNGDGGWGWWPRGTSQPFVTALALEALAAADRAGLDAPPEVVERGVAAAEAALDDQRSSADLRAYLLYALALHNRADPAALHDLAADRARWGPKGSPRSSWRALPRRASPTPPW